MRYIVCEDDQSSFRFHPSLFSQYRHLAADDDASCCLWTFSSGNKFGNNSISVNRLPRYFENLIYEGDVHRPSNSLPFCFVKDYYQSLLSTRILTEIDTTQYFSTIRICLRTKHFQWICLTFLFIYMKDTTICTSKWVKQLPWIFY